MRRVSSLASCAPSIAKGIGSERARILPSRTCTSISPVAIFGLTLSGSRRTTSPSTSTTYSRRAGCRGLRHLRRALGVDDGLDDAAPVANVQEDHAAVIATAVDPPLDLRLFADLVGRQGSCPGSLHLLIRCAVLLAGPAFRASRRPVREAPDPRTTTALRGRRSSLRRPRQTRPAESAPGYAPKSPSRGPLPSSLRPRQTARSTGTRGGPPASVEP